MYTSFLSLLVKPCCRLIFISSLSAFGLSMIFVFKISSLICFRLHSVFQKFVTALFIKCVFPKCLDAIFIIVYPFLEIKGRPQPNITAHKEHQEKELYHNYPNTTGRKATDSKTNSPISSQRGSNNDKELNKC